MIGFISPLALLFLLLLPPLWALMLFGTGQIVRRRTWQFWSHLGVRSLALIALTFAIAGAQMVVPSRDLTVVFLLDRSDSLAPAERERADAYVRQALAHLPPDVRAGVVVFGQ